MKVAVLFSGGKDSCLALHKALKKGHEVKYLLTILPETQESFMFHTPYLPLLERQAKELGIKLITIKSKAEKEKELEDLEKLIGEVKGEIDAIVVGGIASNYQGERVKKICDKLDLRFYAPLWNYKPEDIWKELFSEEFKVIITKIACEGMPPDIIGKVIDEKIFEKLKKNSEKYKFRLDFEGGEAETSVLYIPEFKKQIAIRFKIIEEGPHNALLDISEVI